MEERKRLLQKKISINKPKCARTHVLNMLPADITVVMEESEYITSPDLETILNQVQEIWHNELHKADFREKYPDFRKEFSWEHEVIDYVRNIEMDRKRVYLSFGIEDCPLFLVDGRWALMNFSTLWEKTNHDDIWIIGRDLTHGVLVSRYAGYLGHDPNPKEIVYAITSWGNKIVSA